MQRPDSPDKLVILKRTDASSPWQPLDTRRAGTTLVSIGHTTFSEFTIGAASAAASASDWHLHD